MPLLVTDDNVLSQIATDDKLAQGVDQQFTTLAGSAYFQTDKGKATLAAWKTRLAAYQAWAEIAKKDLSGGILFGAWFGVPNYANQSLAWADEFGAGTATQPGWQTVLNQIAANQVPTVIAPTPISPQQVADQNLAVPLPSVSTGTQFLIGGAIVLGLVLVLKKG